MGWAGRLGAHEPHPRFGSYGRLPHLQLNLWRPGIKGSGIAFRLPLIPPRLLLVRAVLAMGVVPIR